MQIIETTLTYAGISYTLSNSEILDSINTACDNFDNFLEMKRDLEDLRKFACMGYEWVRLVYNGNGEKLWVLEKYKDEYVNSIDKSYKNSTYEMIKRK